MTPLVSDGWLAVVALRKASDDAKPLTLEVAQVRALLALHDDRERTIAELRDAARGVR